MEALWPRYSLYSAEEIRGGLSRSRFVFISLAFFLGAVLLVAFFKDSVPLMVGSGLGILLNLFAWVFVSRKHSCAAAAVLVLCNVFVASVHVLFLQPGSAISIALSVYSINMLRACLSLRKINSNY